MEEITIKLPIDLFLRGQHQYEDGYCLEDKLIAEVVFKEFLYNIHCLSENALSFHIVKVPYTQYEKDEVMFRYRITEEDIRDLRPYNLKIIFTDEPIVRIENPPLPIRFEPLPERLTWWQKLKKKLKNRRIKDRRE